MASRRSSWGGAMETYWAAPAAARDHVAALGRPSTVCVPVGSARIAQGGAQQHGDHEASITPIVGCQPDLGCHAVNCGLHRLPRGQALIQPVFPSWKKRPVVAQSAVALLLEAAPH